VSGKKISDLTATSAVSASDVIVIQKGSGSAQKATVTQLEAALSLNAVTSMVNLSDVSVSTLNDDHVLAWSSSDSKFINKKFFTEVSADSKYLTETSADSKYLQDITSEAIGDLSDVSIATSNAAGQPIIYDGTDYVNNRNIILNADGTVEANTVSLANGIYGGEGHFTKVSVSGTIEIGDPGSEVSGVNINGTTYEGKLRINDISNTYRAQVVLHKHSSNFPAAIVGTRSNGSTSVHVTVSATDTLFRLYGAGWTGTHYDTFGQIDFAVADSAAVSTGSSPGKIILKTTQEGSNTPVTAQVIDENQDVTFVGDVAVSGTITQGGNAVLDATTTLNDIAQVSTDGATNDQVLVYNTSASPNEWRMVSVAAINAQSFNDLTDVSIVSAADEQLIRYNASAGYWENWTPNFITQSSATAEFLSVGTTLFTEASAQSQFLSVGQTLFTETSADAKYLQDITGENLGTLADVSITGVADNEVLTWSSTEGQWTATSAAGGGIDSIASATDVSTVAVADNHLLQYDNAQSKFIPVSLGAVAFDNDYNSLTNLPTLFTEGSAQSQFLSVGTTLFTEASAQTQFLSVGTVLFTETSADAKYLQDLTGSSLGELSNVSAASPADNTALVWSSVESQWIASSVGSVTFSDDVFRIYDNADNSKLLAFEISSISPATTRTWTVPDNDWNLDIAYDFTQVSGRLGKSTDLDTYVSFGTDRLDVYAGGALFVNFVESGTDAITFNPLGSDINFGVYGNGSYAIRYDQGLNKWSFFGTNANASFDIQSTDGMIIPRGTDAQRVSAASGAFRYNTDTSAFEGYNGQWVEFVERTSAGALVGVSLDNISDVSVSGVADNEVLAWSSAAAQWVATSVGGVYTGGKALQILQTEGSGNYGTTNSSYVAVTAVAVTITPTDSTNNILVEVAGSGLVTTPASTAHGIAILRGATQITQQNQVKLNTGGTNTEPHSFAIAKLDSPASTGPIVYYLAHKRTLGSGTVYINGTGQQQSTITVTEVEA
jgi:hypothetical protein